MIAGIVGLGLIGGSFAKAYHKAGETVYAYNRSKNVLDFAILSGDVDAELTTENIGNCDIIIVCVFPEAAAEYLRSVGKFIGNKPIVIDTCGTKRKVCSLCSAVAKEYGFTYVGGHPMAGTQYSGYKYALPNMYHNAPMVLVPQTSDDIELLDRVESLLKPCGFGKFSVTTAEKHDKMIAFTSQMAHVISTAYIKSPSAMDHKGISAGSYRDMTRVARLNPQLWADLFLENSDYLLDELGFFIHSLQEYQNAIQNGDREELVRLLDEGRKAKEKVDGLR